MRHWLDVRSALATLIAGVFILTLTGCPSDPFDPETWIDKLDDPAEVERAIIELERLKDPVAIKPLAKTWRKHSKWAKVLRVIINLADQPVDRGGPYWTDAIPVLIEAVEEFDIGDRRSIEDAVVAADALGRAKEIESIQILISAATKKMPKLSPGQRVRIAAVRALGNFGKNDRAVATLIKILEAPASAQPLQLNAAAANALAETRSTKALQPLLKSLYAISPIYQQVRSAITRVGEPAVGELVKIFKGQHKEINKYAKEQGFSDGCDVAQGPDTKCKAPGNLQFKAAALLGDLRATKAVPVLTAELKKTGMVAFFDPKTGAPGPSAHNAILDALRNIGDPKAGPAVLAYLKDSTTDDLVRPIAIDVYSMLTTDTSGIPHLAALMKNDGEEEQIRKASGLAVGRLARSKKDLQPLQFMVDRYKKEAVKKDVAAKKAKKEGEKERMEGQAEGYRDLAREFEQYKTRGLVGIKCKKDPKCYVGYLSKTPDQIVKELNIKDAGEMKKPAKAAYRIAAVERSLIEIAKMGPKANGVLQDLLKHAGSTERIVRQGVLLALTRVAAVPCQACGDKLHAVIEEQRGQTTLDYLTADTKIVLNYFMWAGGGVTPKPYVKKSKKRKGAEQAAPEKEGKKGE